MASKFQVTKHFIDFKSTSLKWRRKRWRVQTIQTSVSEWFKMDLISSASYCLFLMFQAVSRKTLMVFKTLEEKKRIWNWTGKTWEDNEPYSYKRYRCRRSRRHLFSAQLWNTNTKHLLDYIFSERKLIVMKENYRILYNLLQTVSTSYFQHLYVCLSSSINYNCFHNFLFLILNTRQVKLFQNGKQSTWIVSLGCFNIQELFSCQTNL